MLLRPTLASRGRSLPSAAIMLLVLCAVALAVRVTYVHQLHAGVETLREDASRQLRLLAADLSASLARHETLPVALGMDPQLMAMLSRPGDAAGVDAVNRRLAQLMHGTRVGYIYVMDAKGLTLAASNWDTPQSFVGQDFGWRSYFHDALATGVGRLFAVGTVTGEPGYYIARRVDDAAGRVLGVVAVKISLEELERNWRKAPGALLVADASGVTILSSRPAWRYRVLNDTGEANRARLAATQQYGRAALQPLRLEGPDASGVVRVSAPGAPGAEAVEPDVVQAQLPVGPIGWTLLSFTDARPAARDARADAAATGFALAFLAVAGLYARLRARRDAERRRAREQLAEAHAELERKIEARTAVLRSANDELEAKIEELDRTQATLRATQDELVQAGKLAALGQMAATITHEINQPLAALHATNDNALLLLARGQQAQAASNLETIRELSGRIAGFLRELKGFARKDDLRPSAVDVGLAIDAAVAMVAADARHRGVAIDVRLSGGPLHAQGQPVRVEQVLVNLLRNALDACAGAAIRCVTVAARREGDRVVVTVADTGPGIDEDVLPRLFEPFFTTKASADGLGLGLAISASIAAASGGTLQAANGEGGGACFTLRLPAAGEAEVAALAAAPAARATIG